MRKIDIDNWNRKFHFQAFQKFEDPFFNITAEVDITNLLKLKEQGVSLFQSTYFLALKSLNNLEEFRYRIRNNEVIVHDKIDGACTILNDDNTFSYGYFQYSEKFSDFSLNAKSELAALKKEKCLDPKFERDDVVHSSVIPWVSFTSFEHAKRIAVGDSVPKLVLSKYKKQASNYLMPVSISVHHSLADGYHVGLFFKQYQNLLDNAFEIIKP